MTLEQKGLSFPRFKSSFFKSTNWLPSRHPTTANPHQVWGRRVYVAVCEPSRRPGVFWLILAP